MWQLTLMEWSMEPEYSLLAPTTSVTTARVWPVSDAAGSKQLVAALNFHASIVPSCNRNFPLSKENHSHDKKTVEP